jgi:hypothetical protein
MTRTTTRPKSRISDPLKDATIATLKRIVHPLAELMFDTGVTVREFSQIMRETAVRSAARRVTREGGRDSKSRVAIITGLPRSEVARILESNDEVPGDRTRQHPARKVLAAWFENSRFLGENGEPAVLPIFGKRRSFEQLVTLHAAGIPVRAMLDELKEINAVEILADQTVRAKSRVPVLTGLTGNAVTRIGERAKDLLDTLGHNLRGTSKPLFEGTAFVDDADIESISLIRREIDAQAINFINNANSLFSRNASKPGRLGSKGNSKCRLGVTVYYFEDEGEGGAMSARATQFLRRKNLQRQRCTTNGRKK